MILSFALFNNKVSAMTVGQHLLDEGLLGGEVAFLLLLELLLEALTAGTVFVVQLAHLVGEGVILWLVFVLVATFGDEALEGAGVLLAVEFAEAAPEG